MAQVLKVMRTPPSMLVRILAVGKLKTPSDKRHKCIYEMRHEEQYLYLVPKLHNQNILRTPPETVDKLSGKTITERSAKI